MRKAYKVLVLFVVLIAIVLAANWTRFLLLMEQIYLSGLIWIFIIILMAIPVLYALDKWFGIWSWNFLHKRYGSVKWIPQPKRIEIGKAWAEEHWKSITASGGVLTFVDNYIPPRREDAHPVELMLFTTEKVFKDQRIDPRTIPQEKRFYVFVDCIHGECFSMAYMNTMLTEDAIKFLVQHWYMSIKQRVETPIERRMQQAFAEGMGQELGKKEAEEKKEEVKA